MDELSLALGHVSVRLVIEGSLTESVAPSFAAFTRGDPGPCSQIVEVRVECASRPIASPGEAGLVPSCQFGAVDGFSPHRKLELWDGHSLVVGDLAESTVQAKVSASSDLHTVGSVMLFATTAVAVRSHGLFHLHAGCVDVSGVGPTLVIGESGSGKTTLTLALWAAGAEFLADDTVFLRSNRETGTDIAGWPRDLHVTEETLAAFPSLSSSVGRPVSEGRSKRTLPTNALGRLAKSVLGDPAVLLFPRVTGVARAELTRLSPDACVSRLLASSGLLAIPGAARVAEHLELLAALSTRAAAFDVELGRDVLTSAVPFTERLREACPSSRRRDTLDE